MSAEERRAEAAFYLDSIITKKEFDAMGKDQQHAFKKGGGIVDMAA